MPWSSCHKNLLLKKSIFSFTPLGNLKNEIIYMGTLLKLELIKINLPPIDNQFWFLHSSHRSGCAEWALSLPSSCSPVAAATTSHRAVSAAAPELSSAMPQPSTMTRPMSPPAPCHLSSHLLQAEVGDTMAGLPQHLVRGRRRQRSIVRRLMAAQAIDGVGQQKLLHLAQPNIPVHGLLFPPVDCFDSNAPGSGRQLLQPSVRPDHGRQLQQGCPPIAMTR